MKVCFFDFETGGLQPHHPNTQLAGVVVDENWNEVATYEAKIQFREEDADPKALEINHYSRERWADAKPEALVAAEFDRFLRDHATIRMVNREGKEYFLARLAGHNILSFDMPRLRDMFARHGRNWVPAHHHGLDTHQRALWLAEEASVAFESFKLTDCCKALGVTVDIAHDALADCRLSAAVARAIRKFKEAA